MSGSPRTGGVKEELWREGKVSTYSGYSWGSTQVPLKGFSLPLPQLVSFASSSPHLRLFKGLLKGYRSHCAHRQSQKCSGNLHPPTLRWALASDWLVWECESPASWQQVRTKTLRPNLYSKVPLWHQAEATLHGTLFEITHLLGFSPPVSCFSYSFSSFSWEHFLNRLLAHEVPFHSLLLKNPT